MPPAAVILVFQRAKEGKENNGWDSPIPALDLFNLYPTSRTWHNRTLFSEKKHRQIPNLPIQLFAAAYPLTVFRILWLVA